MKVLSPSSWCTYNGSTGIASPMIRYATSTTTMIGASAPMMEVGGSARSTRTACPVPVRTGGSASSGLAIVLLVGDVLEPLDRLAVERFLNGDVLHRVLGRRAVPVLLARREPD